MKKMHGFTLIELLVVFVILFVVAGIAIPSYLHYVKRARYSQMISATIAVKAGIQDCYNTIGKVQGCNNNILSIPPAIIKGSNVIKSMIVKNGVITIIPNTGAGLKSSDVFYLIPEVNSHGIIEWTLSGRGIKNYASTSIGKVVDENAYELTI